MDKLPFLSESIEGIGSCQGVSVLSTGGVVREVFVSSEGSLSGTSGLSCKQIVRNGGGKMRQRFSVAVVGVERRSDKDSEAGIRMD